MMMRVTAKPGLGKYQRFPLVDQNMYDFAVVKQATQARQRNDFMSERA